MRFTFKMKHRRHAPQYSDYIRSDAWRDKHRAWLQQGQYRCAMLPWVVVGRQVNGQYRSYRIHHLHYGNLGREQYWWDVLPLCPFAHDWIIHGVLSGWRSAGQQQYYPNTAQRMAHAWCRLPSFLKAITWFAALVVVAMVWIGVQEAATQWNAVG